MKAIMSEKLRKIIRDPKKAEDLNKGVSQLRTKTGDARESAKISIGGLNYNIKFVSPDSKDNE